MNLKKMWKRFWNLNVHNHEGFTLVELIIVIAILAILSSVAVVGYSSYIKKANKQADMTLAADIKNVLTLAMYNDALAEGDYVIIRFGAEAEWLKSSATIYDVMAAAYGTNWENTLQLKYNGWDVGVAGDEYMMNAIENSNFSTDKVDTLLGKVQLVVSAASGYLGNVGETKIENQDLLDILTAGGIELVDGKVTAENAQAAANAYVFAVAGELADINTNIPTDGSNPDQAFVNFISGWVTGDFSTMDWEDNIVADAAKYARAVAAAEYVDGKLGLVGDASYAAKLESYNGDPRKGAENIISQMNADSNAKTYVNEYFGSECCTNDALAFLGYMQGVTSNTDSLLGMTDLNNTQYFSDGTVGNYVTSYLTMSDALINAGIDGSAFVFLFSNGEIRCLPLD